MRFVIAPDWLMQLPDDALRNSKQVLDLYGYAIIKSYSANRLIKAGHLPKPDRFVRRGPKRNTPYWTARHGKNNVKLPDEIKPL